MRPVHLDSFQCSFVFRHKDLPFLWVSSGHLSREGFLREKGGEKGQNYFLFLPFLQIPQLKIFNTPRFHAFTPPGSNVLNSDTTSHFCILYMGLSACNRIGLELVYEFVYKFMNVIAQ